MRVVDNLCTGFASCEFPAFTDIARGAHLDERLDLAPLRELLRTHALGDLQWVALDAGNDGVGVGALLGALVELLDYDDLLARLTALQNNCNLQNERNDEHEVARAVTGS